ncbi:MAG: AbrB/MazE/SpoVT family DNA-binding domain-containing protein [Deinococcota bacterium]|jgi:AbrB family looped-hinge helix DNA binding protein|nr:AbrB/MazE/SpoVT family DNA-binding domain-containing protein [Deinococcota bacterium]
MTLAKLTEKGQLSLPEAVLEQLGLKGETMLTVTVTADGGIVLRPAHMPVGDGTSSRAALYALVEPLASQGLMRDILAKNKQAKLAQAQGAA